MMANIDWRTEQQHMDGNILEKDYCPPLDTALFYAVIGDLVPDDATSVQDIRRILDSLKDSAEIEQGTDFDPSGTANVSKLDETQASVKFGDLSITEESETTSITEPSIRPNDIPDAYDEGIEELSNTEKAKLLRDLCPEVSLFDIEFMLKKYQGSFRRSLDESLNLVWIQNNHIVHKGVDGFFQEAPKIRKRKDRNISHTNLFYEYESQQDLPLPQKNVWQINEGQINFIASRVRLSESLVRSTYHKAGSSVRLTILGLCKVDTGDISGVSINDITLQVNAAELGQEFPHLSNDQCLSLIILTHPFTARAHELAKVICTSSSISSSAPASSTKLIPHYAPAKLGNDATIVTREDQPSNVKNLSQTNLNQAAIKHALHREQMFSKANVAWRKSRSNHLMGGAAAYYGEEGRKADAANRAYSSAIADAQVHSTATSSSIDLHGVNVQDAVRNAKDAVQRWWNTGQAEWAREGKAPGGNGYTIITGAGTHSQGGKARIRPAVINMLKTEGWRVEEDAVRGQLIVLGRSRIR